MVVDFEFSPSVGDAIDDCSRDLDDVGDRQRVPEEVDEGDSGEEDPSSTC